MAVDGTIVKTNTGAHLAATRDAAGNLVMTPAFPTLVNGAPIALLPGSPNLATVVTKLNEIIARVNAIIVATGMSA